MFAVFFFSKLWKRAGVLTEVEFVELRYSGKEAAFLRGFKSLYWGIFYNAFIMGAWPMTGLAKVMHSLKSYTAHETNKFLARAGSFWQHESYDHWVRDDDELERIVAYINANPVKAGLAQRACDFFWCSAHDRFLHDGDQSGWLEHPTSEAR